MSNEKALKIIDCPRDAMQGIDEFIPTEKKVEYINALLKVGFHTLDFGSFVSPKAIPQMKDTAEVLRKIDLTNTATQLLAIVANEKGATEAIQYDAIDYLGYPFSISETFQQRNTNASIEDSLKRLDNINTLASKSNKVMVVYLSMGFGNPYGDPYHEDIVAEWIERLKEFEIQTFALSDTIGIATEESIDRLFKTIIPEFYGLEIGAHLHTTPHTWKEKIEAAYEAGCRRFDGAVAGFGGCPMAADELTGNMPTEKMVDYFKQKELLKEIDQDQLNTCMAMASSIFPA